MSNEFKSKEQRVEDWRRNFANHSDSSLIEEMSNQSESSERHIAAKQLLHERNQAFDNKALATAQRANHLSKWAILIALLALSATVLQILLQWREAPKAASEPSRQTSPSTDVQPSHSISTTPPAKPLAGDKP